MKFTLGIIFLIFSNFWPLHSQTSLFNRSLQPYQIDSSIHKILKGGSKLINDIPYGTADIKLITNDSLLGENHNAAKGIDVQVIAYLDGDTIKILGKTMFGFDYRISLLENNAIVQYITDYEGGTFKLTQTDSLSISLTIYCTDFKLTLTRQPVFEKGKIVEGILEFSTPEYFVVEDGWESKDKMKIKAFFRCYID